MSCNDRETTTGKVPGLPEDLGARRVLLIGTGAPTTASLPIVAGLLRSSYGTEVKVALTAAARRLVSVAMLSAISGQPVLPTQWADDVNGGPLHVTWARWPDIIVVWPATLEFMARCATGLSSDVPAAVVLSSRAPVLFAPSLAPAAVHSGPYRRIRTQLLEDGHEVVNPVVGISLSDFSLSEGACVDLRTLFHEIRRVWDKQPVG